MRWSYKTVHYELKKEGLLGSTFLDESEVELSLNEYGKSGWELVSLLETMDGLVAVFKQPLSLETESFYPPVQEEDGSEKEEVELPEEEQFIVEPLSTQDDSTYDDEVVLVEEFDVIGDEEPKPEKVGKNRKSDADIGAIIIE